MRGFKHLATSPCLPLLIHWFQNLERAHQIRVHTHHGSSVVELATIVRSGEDGDQLPPREKLVAILYDLVSSADQVQTRSRKELRDNILAERKTDSPVALTPTANVRLRVRPQQITQEASIRNVSRSWDFTQLLQTLQLRRQPRVDTQDLVLDDRAEGQAVEHLVERFPDTRVVSPFAFIIEPVDTVDWRCLVIATQQKEVFGILDFETKQ